jgi:protein-S-isoprenylcysteine O-methyltransferase Ste14
MTQAALSRIVFLVLLVLLVLVRAFFSVASGKDGHPHQAKQAIVGREGIAGYILSHFVIGREGKVSFILRRFIATPALVLLLCLDFTDSPWMRPFSIPYPQGGMWLGAGLGTAGLVFLIWVHMHLGKEWSVSLQLNQDHRLIQSGPYSKIRHPMYTAIFAVYLGLSLISANTLVVFVMVLFILSGVARIPQEERMLIERFGDAYRDYIKKTGMFLPKL